MFAGDDVCQAHVDARLLVDQLVDIAGAIGVATLIGKAFDSLFRELCAQQALLTPSGEQILAPFAFVSNLAGALLALELARF